MVDTRRARHPDPGSPPPPVSKARTSQTPRSAYDMFRHDYRMPEVVAEIGCNHLGQMAIAKELIDLARQAGAHHVKFQKRTNHELLSQEQREAPHPNPMHS